MFGGHETFGLQRTCNGPGGQYVDVRGWARFKEGRVGVWTSGSGRGGGARLLGWLRV